MNELVERVFPVGDRRIPLDHTPLNQLPTWGHWLETPHLIAAMLTPGQLEVNLLAPFEFISTRFQPGHGIAAFDSDKLIPYHAIPGGYDVVPQGSTYRSIETAGCCILLAYKQPLASRIMAEYTNEGYCQLNQRYSKLSTTIPQSSGSLNFMQPFSSKQLLANLEIAGGVVVDIVVQSVDVVSRGSVLEWVQMQREIVGLVQGI